MCSSAWSTQGTVRARNRLFTQSNRLAPKDWVRNNSILAHTKSPDLLDHIRMSTAYPPTDAPYSSIRSLRSVYSEKSFDMEFTAMMLMGLDVIWETIGFHRLAQTLLHRRRRKADSALIILGARHMCLLEALFWLNMIYSSTTVLDLIFSFYKIKHGIYKGY